MPVRYDRFGIAFLYPDNWKEIPRDESEGNEGVTLELPNGGFFTLEREQHGQFADEIIEEVAESIEEDYGDIEREELKCPDTGIEQRAVEFRFYYLDLLIVSRLVVLHRNGETLLVQMQAESRNFDENELVFEALLKQIREA